MNPRQRRGALLIGVAIIAAALVAVGVVRYLGEVRSQLGPMVTIVATSSDLAAYTPITVDHLTTAEVPERWAPPNTYTDASQLLGLVTSADVPAGTLMTDGLVQDRPSVEPGQREIAVMVDAETGVAGKIRSGDLVDIFATFDGSDTVPPSARIVVQRAQILEVGTPVGEDGELRGFEGSARVPITFLLSVPDARTLTYVESFANSIRLALRSPLDDALLGDDDTVFVPGPDDLGRIGEPLPAPEFDPDQQEESPDPPDETDADPPVEDEEDGDDEEVEP
jgi:Flp pilus assembly protein CpaB